MYEPCICLLAQGEKRVMLRDEEHVYDANHYMITSLGLPVANVVEASKESPLLGLALKIDLCVVAQLMVDSSLPMSPTQQSGRGMSFDQTVGA